LDKTEDDRLIE